MASFLLCFAVFETVHKFTSLHSPAYARHQSHAKIKAKETLIQDITEELEARSGGGKNGSSSSWNGENQ